MEDLPPGFSPDRSDVVDTAAGYSVQNGCIVRHGEKGTRTLANFHARIVREEIHDDGAEEVLRFRIEGALTSGRAFEAEVPAARFAAMAWPVEAIGAQAIVSPGQGTRDVLRHAIQALSGDIQRHRVYAATGWRTIDGAPGYLHAGGAIGPEGPVPGVEVALPEKLAGFALPDPPEGEARRSAVRASLEVLEVAPLRVTAPVLGAVYRAMLGAPDFGVFLAGRTGIGKSEIAALAQQHYGANLHARALPESFASTANALESTAFHAADALLVVDDFAPSGSPHDVSRYHATAERLFRSTGNRQGRSRLGRDGHTLRLAKPPRALTLATGEDLPRGASIRARVLIVEVGPEDVDWSKLSELQRHAGDGDFAQSLAAFAQWAARQREAILAEVREAVERWRREALGHHRTPEIVGALSGALGVFLRFAVATGALRQAEANALGKALDGALLAVGAAQSELQQSEDVVARYLSSLRTALVAGECHLAHADDADGAGWPDRERFGWRRRDSAWEAQGRRIGWVRGASIYLEPGAAYNVAAAVARGSGASLPAGEKTLAKRLAEAGLLAEKEAGRNTVKKHVGSDRPRVLVLAASTLFDDAEAVNDGAVRPDTLPPGDSLPETASGLDALELQ